MSACRPSKIGRTDSRGYKQIHVGKGKRVLAHRKAYEDAYGPIPEGMVVRHMCDNPPCVNLEHLELGTHADNMRDMAERGRAYRPTWRGETAPGAKLTEDDVRFIRQSPMRGVDLAAMFGVGKANITNIRKRRTWTHVD